MTAFVVALGPTLLGSGCGAVVVGADPPTDRPLFPTGLALTPDGDHLVVVSSDFDLAFDEGAVLLADLAHARTKLGDASSVVTDAYVSAVTVPPFGDRPVLDGTGAHLFVTTRGGNLLHEIQLDDGALHCGGDDACGEPPFVLQLGGNDPFDVLLVDEVGGPDGLVSARGIVTHLSSPEAEIFTLDADELGAARLRQETARISFGEDVFGVRSAVLAPAGAFADPRVYATLERRVDNVILGTDLAFFDVPGIGAGDDAVVFRLDLTQVTGALTARDLILVPDPSRGDGALAAVVALRGPDAIARFDVDPVSGDVSLTALADTCKEPTGLAFADLKTASADRADDRVLVTCQAGHVVQAIDPLTLAITDAVRFYGRAPYDVVYDPVHREAFVSFFLDDSVGVLRFVDDDGGVALVPVGRIGEALPPPEDGRE